MYQEIASAHLTVWFVADFASVEYEYGVKRLSAAGNTCTINIYVLPELYNTSSIHWGHFVLGETF